VNTVTIVARAPRDSLKFGASLCLGFFLFTASGLTAFAAVYNNSQAARYADKWVDSDEADNIRNPFYYHSGQGSNDCANYVTQCLIAGYIPTYNSGGLQVNHSLIRCDDLAVSLHNLFSDDSARVSAGGNAPDFMGAGDVVIYGDNNDAYRHAVVVVAGTGAQILCNAHTSERCHKPFSYWLSEFPLATCYHVKHSAGVGADLSPSFSYPLVLSNTFNQVRTPLHASPCFTYADVSMGNYLASDIPDTTYVCLNLYGSGGLTELGKVLVALPPFLYDQTAQAFDVPFEMPESGSCKVEMVVDNFWYWAETSESNNACERFDDYVPCDQNPEPYATDFQATASGRAIVIKWAARPRQDLIGFSLHRWADGEVPSRLSEIPASWDGGDSQNEHEFTYIDEDVRPGRQYNYRLDGEFNNGSTLALASASIFLPGRPGVLTSATLPNPFGDLTSVRFEIEVAGEVSAGIFDVGGRLVKAFPTIWREPGEHRLVWDGKRNDGEILPPGLYLCKVCIGSHCKVEKVVLLR
jgi:hypothetical protein